MPQDSTSFQRSSLSIISLGFSLAAAYHLLEFANPSAGDDCSPLRHLCFVLIDSVFAVLFRIQVPGLRWMFLVFAIQQFYHHGLRLQKLYPNPSTLSLIDGLVLVFMTGVLWLLFRNKSRHPCEASVVDGR